jgi:hypothetical protein
VSIPDRSNDFRRGTMIVNLTAGARRLRHVVWQSSWNMDMRYRLWCAMSALALLSSAVPEVEGVLAQASEFGHSAPSIASSQTINVGGASLQIDFADGALDLSKSIVVTRIQTAAHAVATYYGRFPVPRARILIIPVSGRHGVLQGTTWGDRDGFPALLRLRLGQTTTPEELADDWIITHELVHPALASLPDDQHWLEEGLATYIEPIARAQASELTAQSVWRDMMHGMPNGEPGPNDRGLDRTHTWGRTYWGGALFCLMADVQIRRQTGNRQGLQNALRAVVAAGGTIDKQWPLERILRTGDQATGTRVMEEMYARWSESPVSIDLPQLWEQLGLRAEPGGVTFNASAPLAAIRTSITAAPAPNAAGGQ